MPINVTMPRMSDTMEQGTVVKWHKKVGDKVKPGDVLADIETDKATMELEAFDEGTIAKLAVEAGSSVSVGGLIVVIASEGEDLATVASSAGHTSASSKAKAGGTAVSSVAASATATIPGAPAASSSDENRSSNGHGRVFASPLARKIASERGIDLSSIAGSGPSGRVVRKDVEQAAPSRGGTSHGGTGVPPVSPSSVSHPITTPPASATLESKNVPLSNMRATIARRLVQSKTTIPHYQVTVSARLDKLMELREQLNTQLESQGVKLSVNDFLVRACALAMHQHPYINSSWNDKGPSIDLYGSVNVGVAISLPAERGGGLVVATIRDADRHGLRHISAETKRLAKKAREKGLPPEEMADSTFTISNLGMFGVDHFTAIINPPNAAILAVGAAIEKPFIETDEDGEKVITLGHEMAMTMSSDHRIIDGAMAAAYLATVKQLLESPAALLV
jgi:pyruvate dehydrogenase E2 component (dihydrolipoamide acetyltransferase)